MLMTFIGIAILVLLIRVVGLAFFVDYRKLLISNLVFVAVEAVSIGLICIVTTNANADGDINKTVILWGAFMTGWVIGTIPYLLTTKN